MAHTPERHAGDLTTEFPSLLPTVERDEREAPPANIDPTIAADAVLPRGGVGGPANAAEIEQAAGLLTRHAGGSGAAGWSTASPQTPDTGQPGGERWRVSLHNLESRPGWHGAMTPAAVQEAWTVVLDAVTVARDQAAKVEEVAVDQRAAEQAETAAIRTAARDGAEAPQAAKAVDWESLRRKRAAAAMGLLDRARSARSDYSQVVAAELPDWTSTLEAEVQPHHVAAAQALGKAQQEMEQLTSLIQLVQNLGAERGEDRVPLPQFGPARDGIAAALNILGRLKTHEPLTETKVKPSRQERLALAHSGDMHCLWQLQQIELKENFQVTQHMKGLLLEKVPGPYSSDA